MSSAAESIARTKYIYLNQTAIDVLRKRYASPFLMEPTPWRYGLCRCVVTTEIMNRLAEERLVDEFLSQCVVRVYSDQQKAN
jgi:hypothetical protein